MRAPMVRPVRAVCETLADCHNLLALDLANEIDVVCPQVTPATLQSRTAEPGGTVQAVIPGLPVTNGVATNPNEAGTPWTFADQQVDFHCMHGYPMYWNPLPVLSMASPRASLIFGALTAFAEAYGPVRRQEYGSGMGGDGEVVSGFVRASSFASFLAGANGFLYWTWRDFVRHRGSRRDRFTTGQQIDEHPYPPVGGVHGTLPPLA